MKGSPRAAVLMYHRLSARAFDPIEGDYVVPRETFEQQMRMLVLERRPVASIEDVLSGRFAHRSVALTFDDGCDTDLTVALPVLSALSLPAAFFVNPGTIGQGGYLTWAGLRELAAAGMHIGSHGLDHTLLDGLSEAELERQLVVSKELLESHLGAGVNTLALPGGSGGERACRFAQRHGYRAVFGSQPGLIGGGPLPAVIPRFPVRQGGLRRFRAIVDQDVGLRMRHAVRYGTLGLMRAVVGRNTYFRMRARWLRSDPQNTPRRRG
jgi:peptidoglycan/xylan/chitin deacetylase (PgdA/CDA1 family)